MKKIILIHTVQSMYLTFEKRLREALNVEVRIDNILDTFFATNSNEIGYFSQENVDRLYMTLKSAELTGADVIATICSTLTPHAEKIAPLIPVPIVLIDSRLGDSALSYGDNLIIVASAPSAAEATNLLIHKAAKVAGRVIDLESKYDIRALHSLLSGDVETHDKYILEMVSTIHDKDAIVFAQGSMEHIKEAVEKTTGLPVVTAPSLCIQEIKEIVEA